MTHTDPYVASLPTLEALADLPPADAHQRHCQSGWIESRDTTTGYAKSIECPYCAMRQQEHLLELAIEASGIGRRYYATNWEDLDLPDPLPALKAASDRITEIITAGHNAVLAGPPGTGKTQAATLLLKAAIHAGYRARLENIGHIAMNIRAGYDGEGDTEAEAVRRLTHPDLLVIDDIGAGEAGDGKIEKRVLYFVLEARQNTRKATIVTTNLTAQQLSTFLGERIINRLMPLEVFNFAHGRNFRAPTGQNAWTTAAKEVA